jgi:hypothetical protein
LFELRNALNAAIGQDNSIKKETADKSGLLEILYEVKSAAEGYDRDYALELIAPCAGFAYDVVADALLKEIIISLEDFDCEGASKKIERLEEILKV